MITVDTWKWEKLTGQQRTAPMIAFSRALIKSGTIFMLSGSIRRFTKRTATVYSMSLSKYFFRKYLSIFLKILMESDIYINN